MTISRYESSNEKGRVLVTRDQGATSGTRLHEIGVRPRMIDTIKIISPSITPAIEAAVYRLCRQRHSLVDTETGTVEWEFFTGEIRDSWDARIGLSLVDHEIVNRNGKPEKRKLLHPRLKVECSIHKAMMGHNVFGGPERFQPAVVWLVDELSEQMGCELPNALDWQVQRIDWAEIFQFTSMKSWFAQLKHLYYPRRGESAIRWEATSFWVSTSMIFAKVYQKQAEFLSHDYQRVLKMQGVKHAEFLKQISENIIRCEVELRPRKLKKVHGIEGRNLYVREVCDELVREVWVSEMGKILQFNVSVPETYCDTYAVAKRLQASGLTPKLQMILFGTWQALSTMGEEHCKQMMPKRTFLRHKAELKEMGIAWSSTDAMVVKDDTISWAPRIGCDEHIQGETREIAFMLDICQVAM